MITKKSTKKFRRCIIEYYAAVRVYFKLTFVKAALKYTLHSYRHTFATMLLERGVNPKVVQKLLGHRDIETTLGTYSHVLPEVFDGVAGVVGELHADMVSGNVIKAPIP